MSCVQNAAPRVAQPRFTAASGARNVAKLKPVGARSCRSLASFGADIQRPAKAVGLRVDRPHPVGRNTARRPPAKATSMLGKPMLKRNTTGPFGRAAAVMLAALFAFLATPASAEEFVGTWLTQQGDAQIRVAKCGKAM